MKSQASPKITALGEPELIARARAGSPEAFATLYNENRSEVFRYIRNRVRDEYIAEDLTSETFIRALRNIGSYTWTGRDFAAWLVTIARNIVVDHYKAGRTRLEVAVGDMLEAEAQAYAEESAENRGLRELDAVEARETVQIAMDRLPPGQAAVVRLRYLDELTLAEAAAELGRTVGAVKTATFRAMDTMRRVAVAA